MQNIRYQKGGGGGICHSYEFDKVESKNSVCGQINKIIDLDYVKRKVGAKGKIGIWVDLTHSLRPYVPEQ